MKKHITMGEAVLPFRASVSEGQVTLTDAMGYFVVSFTPEQIAELAHDALRVANTVLLAERDLYRAENTKIRAEAGGMEMEIDDLRVEIDDLRARTASSTQERAAIVAWLRARAAQGLAAENVEGSFIFAVTADHIEAGDHYRDAK